MHLFSLLLKLCLLSSHVSKRQWTSAFKTLPQKVMGFLDKETGRKNLFHFKSLKIKILGNYHCSLVWLFFKLFQRLVVPVWGKRCVEVASSVGLRRAQGVSGKRMIVINTHLLLGLAGFLQEMGSRWWKEVICYSDGSRMADRTPAADRWTLVLTRVCVFCDREF